MDERPKKETYRRSPNQMVRLESAAIRMRMQYVILGERVNLLGAEKWTLKLLLIHHLIGIGAYAFDFDASYPSPISLLSPRDTHSTHAQTRK